jgi:hypothetical protein
MVRCTTKHNDETSDQKTEYGNDLNRGEDELRFSIDVDSENVQEDNDDDDDTDPDSRVVFFFLIPIRDEDSGSRDFGAECDRTLIPIVVTDSETESRIRITSAILRDSAGERSGEVSIEKIVLGSKLTAM